MIRATKKEDLPEVFEVLKQAWLDTYVDLGLDQRAILNMFNDKDAWVAGFEKYVDSGSALTYVAIENDRIIGIIFGRKGAIQSLYLRSDFRKKGHGSKLLEAFIENGLPVHLHVLECNEAAQQFYKKNGFRPTGEFSFFALGDEKYKDLEFIKE